MVIGNTSTFSHSSSSSHFTLYILHSKSGRDRFSLRAKRADGTDGDGQILPGGEVRLRNLVTDPMKLFISSFLSFFLLSYSCGPLAPDLCQARQGPNFADIYIFSALRGNVECCQCGNVASSNVANFQLVIGIGHWQHWQHWQHFTTLPEYQHQGFGFGADDDFAVFHRRAFDPFGQHELQVVRVGEIRAFRHDIASGSDS